jgi:hypothetical protein
MWQIDSVPGINGSDAMTFMFSIGPWYGFDAHWSKHQVSITFGWFVLRVCFGDFERALEAGNKRKKALEEMVVELNHRMRRDLRWHHNQPYRDLLEASLAKAKTLIGEKHKR